MTNRQLPAPPAIGAWTASHPGANRSVSLVLAAAIGRAIGLGAAAIWTARASAALAARGATRAIQATRDARWLQKHPIDYA